MMVKISIKKQIKDFSLDISLDIEKNSFLGISGASGSGKTTFLRVLAGLEKSDGFIKVGDKIWQDKYIFLSPQKRELGFVFQEYALFPNMTVEQNLLYVVDDKKLANHLLDITELKSIKDKYPHTLSGGQQQRVALSRALMGRPKLLLMDEPLSALDIDIKSKLYSEILQLHKEFGTTTIMVSHDRAELEALCSQIITIDKGHIINNDNISYQNAQLLDISKFDDKFIATILVDNKTIKVDIDKKLL